MVTHDGYLVQPAVAVPEDAIDVTINQSGEVLAKLQGQVELQNVGQLQLAIFPNEAGLEAIGGNLFRENAGSGAPVIGQPLGARLRQRPAGLSRDLQRQRRRGDHQPDLGAARLRDELEGHTGGRRDAGDHQQRSLGAPAMPILPLAIFCLLAAFPALFTPALAGEPLAPAFARRRQDAGRAGASRRRSWRPSPIGG